MNHYYAVPLKKGGWYYTCTNQKGVIYPVGYCAEHEAHETKEEAEACYRTYLLDKELHLKIEVPDEQRKCKVCGEWTNLTAQVQNMSRYFLCEQHNNREEMEKLFPPVRYMSSSY